MRKTTVNREMNKVTPLKMGSVKRRIEKRDGSTIGWDTLISVRMKPAPANTLITISETVGRARYPQLYPWLTAIRNDERETVRSTAPVQSKGSSDVRSAWLPLRSLMIKNAVKIPIGTLMKNMKRHENRSISSPPRGGPVVKPAATTVPIMPRAFPRCDAGNVSTTSAGVHAMIIAAPMP